VTKRWGWSCSEQVAGEQAPDPPCTTSTGGFGGVILPQSLLSLSCWKSSAGTEVESSGQAQG